MSEIFEQLESSDQMEVEAAKQKILEQFAIVKDSWLLNGLYEYYLNTNSANTIEILVNTREPHHQFLFDRISDSISKSSKIDVKVQALTLLGHIVRNQPTWLYRLPEHHLLKDMLKLLKVEVEVLPLISALLVLIVLIPMIPYSMSDLLNDVFEIFSRLASWNCNPGRLVEDQMIHMQVALYALFLRLYGMFPCNFLGYLRTQYKDKNRPVFIHTVKPMLETVKMNPSLVTTSKENETTSERWRKISAHDVIVECERFSLDVSDTFCAHDSCQLASGFRSRSGTSNSALADSSYVKSLINLAASMSSSDRSEFFTPSMHYNQNARDFGSHREFTHDENVVPEAGSSPPEAAIEATPETTPNLQASRYIHTKSQIKSLTSTSQPQSPVRKDNKPSFHFSLDMMASGGSLLTTTPPISTKDEIIQLMPMEKSDNQSPIVAASATPKPSTVPSSPLRINVNVHDRKKPSVNRSLKTDQDFNEFMIARGREPSQPTTVKETVFQNESEDSVSETTVDEDRSSPCSAGGLHMPNSRSMKDFARHVRRLRHHSQCNAETDMMGGSVGAMMADDALTAGTSPETMMLMLLNDSSSSSSSNSSKVRRANSCPEMKKSPVGSAVKDSMSRTLLDETDEESNPERAESAMSNGIQDFNTSSDTAHSLPHDVETQTENFFPMPYEHLFLGIFPTLGTESKPSPGPSGGGSQSAQSSQEKYSPPSMYEILDKHVETACMEMGGATGDKDQVRQLKTQLQLLHQQLLFERHRREFHAFKNRRALADAKSTQVLEEHNSALRDQVQLQQNDIDKLREQVESMSRDKEVENGNLLRTIDNLESKCKELEERHRHLREKQDMTQKDLDETKSRCRSLSIEKQKAESSFLEALAEVKFAKEQALAGEKGRAELEYVNKQLVLIGELQLKYKQRLEDLTSLRRYDYELEMMRESHGNELKVLNQHLKEKVTKLDAYSSKVGELEQTVIRNEETIAGQKRALQAVNEENDEKLKVLESKYQTQLTICRTLEEKLWDLYRQLELSQRKPIRSPDTSSCQEVQVSNEKMGTVIALSQRSSPLSSSLASSEGSSAVQNESSARNLQDSSPTQPSTSKLF